MEVAELSAMFTEAGRNAKRRSRSIAAAYGVRLVEEVKAHASGRPGPEVITGQYLDSIYFEVLEIDVVGSTRVVVGSDAPQALRLEYGFVGTDSLGRTVNAPPYPHFGPAADIVEPEFEAALVAVVDLDLVKGA